MDFTRNYLKGLLGEQNQIKFKKKQYFNNYTTDSKSNAEAAVEYK